MKRKYFHTWYETAEEHIWLDHDLSFETNNAVQPSTPQ